MAPSSLLSALDACRRLAAGMWGDDIQVKFDLDLSWLERHSAILYPTLATIAVALVAWGVLGSLRGPGMTVEQRLEYKRQILIKLRLEPTGVPVYKIIEELGLGVTTTHQLIQEMVRDGQVLSLKKGGVPTLMVKLD